MADSPEEAEDIAAICGGLNINIGTLNAATIPAMAVTALLCVAYRKFACGNKKGERCA